ncbi:aldehyde dehydrogenase (NAD+) [Tamaricihabitans halophyticus]|uniref:Aldehyde dehydrogenase (NAD+) n=1 Tax=Tamaricihabitans halophyticus TaxID=1262583 RepID=A0A4R2QYD5_9PSEU|nr:aldehyde dehydrogenase [Tamaricihabitans halophyticus]TCP55252.1 aldehyde dehydrogenase (NAD+) [Tamaricihabitans halophyticus]
MTLTNYELYIDGQAVSSATGDRFESINPYTGKPHATVPRATSAQVDHAVAAAGGAFETWRARPPVQRADLLRTLADLLEADGDRMGDLESTDNGKVVRETRAQMRFAARQYRYFASLAENLQGATIPLDDPTLLDLTHAEPLGVCVLITAWNSPMGLLSNKLAPALAAGNTVVIKPSEHASVTTLEFARLVDRAGFPPGVVNVVTGEADVGKALTDRQDIGKISFTGSPEIGAAIATVAGANLVPVTLELGGKSPNIIFADADLTAALSGAFAGIFAATGQTCVAGSRLLVQRSIYAEVCASLTESSHGIRLGDPTSLDTEMGTCANRQQFDRVLGHIESAKQDGARLLAGGEPEERLLPGLFVQPTIFADVTPDMRLAREEVFGPVLAVMPFDTEQDAVELANATKFGLAAGVWTKDVDRAMRMTRSLRAGTVWVNTYRAVAVQAPFGGFKHSGYGRERGVAALQDYLTTKNVMIDFGGSSRDPFAIRT